MRSAFRFIFVVFCLTALFILAVYLRGSEGRVFYKLCKYRVQEARLKQQLWQRQLQLEGLISPSAVSEYLEGSE